MTSKPAIQKQTTPPSRNGCQSTHYLTLAPAGAAMPALHAIS